MTRGFTAVIVALAIWSAALPLSAHHSFAAEYDRNKPITLKGSVNRMEWANPHVYFYLDVKDEAGKSAIWAIEGGAPNTLYRAGWRKDALKFGDIVTVNGYLARDGSKLVNMRDAILPDGRAVLAGQQDGGPPSKLTKPPGK